MKNTTHVNFILRLLVVLFALLIASPGFCADTPRNRVIVSTDIGGTDPDDFQSMVHLLLYSDVLDIEGLISSPFGPGRKQDILDVIDLYAQDYPNLQTWSGSYPTPDELRGITKQGAIEVAPYVGFREPTEGSQWIVTQARRDDPRPLHILVWGGIEDLAQALHDAPDILPKLRVYFIGGPNKKWSPDAYNYIATQHPELWIIEANSTYRGWFLGGNQEGDWGNQSFVTAHIAGRGALGNFFATQLDGTIKMGDSPSVGWLLHGTSSDPMQAGWGGQFVRPWSRSPVVAHRLTSGEDSLEQFGIFELVLPVKTTGTGKPEASMIVENQSLSGFFDREGNVHFRFSPKDAKTYNYSIGSNVPELNGLSGKISAHPITPDAAQKPNAGTPHWWTDNPAPELAEPPYPGVKTVSRWREDYLGDFAARMMRTQAPAKIPAGDRHQRRGDRRRVFHGPVSALRQ